MGLDRTLLHDLSIRNILYIDRLDLTFGPGLNVLTGETGAGKSILLDALGFVTGVRAGRDLLRSRASSGDVSAGFVIESDHPVQDWLRNQQIACHGDLLLRRTITGSGRTVSFANGSRITAGQLTEIGTQLVDIHGSRKEMGLLNPSEHCRFLDFFAGSTRDARTVHDRWTAVRDLRRRQDDLEAELAEMEKEADYNAHVVAELENLGLEDGEVEVLEQARVRLKAAMKIRTRVEEVRLMSGMEGALGTLIDAIRSLERIDDACGPEIKTAMQALTVATHEIEEAQVQLDRFLGTLDVASDTIEDTEDRLYLIRQLARKHRVQPEELRSVLARLAGQEDRREHLAQECDRIVAAIRAARESYLSDARKLSRLRHAAGDRLDRAVDGELAALRLKGVRFLTDIQDREAGSGGLDRVTFTVSTVRGSPPGPLNDIASGGEMARFMLAIKVCLAGITPGLSIVFDEIDRGVGGATAAAIGKRLAALADQNQTIAVTHSPQVAAHGHQHHVVQRTEDQTGTELAVLPLNGSKRINEIARMLAGSKITAEARAAARQLLRDAGS